MNQQIPEIFHSLDVFKGWEVAEEIGSGGTSRVFRLIGQEDPTQQAALKWIHLERRGDALGARFLDAQADLINEIRTQLSMQDIPQVVAIRAYNVINSPDGNEIDAFSRMDLLTPLTKWMREGGHTVRDVLHVLRDISTAVDACHQRRILHRDIKPENILLDASGFKLSDFGVAGIVLEHSTQSRYTRTFAPPEYRAGGIQDEHGDLFSLGLTAYVLFNNDQMPYQKGFDAESRNQAWAARQEAISAGHKRFPPPCFAGTEQVSDVLCRACALDPADRFPSATAFYAALEQAVYSSQNLISAVLPFHEQREGQPAGGAAPNERREQASVYDTSKPVEHITDTRSTGRQTNRVLESVTPSVSNIPAISAETASANAAIVGWDDDPTRGQKTESNSSGSESIVIPEDPPKPKWKMWVGLAAAVVVLATILLIVLIPKGKQGPVDIATPQATLAMFRVDVNGCNAVIDGKTATTYTLYPENADYLKLEVKTSGGAEEVRGLVPDVTYVITDTLGRSATFDTASQTPESLHILNCRTSVVAYPWVTAKAEGFNPYDSENLNNPTTTHSASMRLKNAKADYQDACYYFQMDLRWADDTRPDARNLRIVLRPESGGIAMDESYTFTPTSSTKSAQTILIPAAPIIEDMVGQGLISDGTADLFFYYDDIRLAEMTVTITKAK